MKIENPGVGRPLVGPAKILKHYGVGHGSVPCRPLFLSFSPFYLIFLVSSPVLPWPWAIRCFRTFSLFFFLALNLGAGLAVHQSLLFVIVNSLLHHLPLLVFLASSASPAISEELPKIDDICKMVFFFNNYKTVFSLWYHFTN